MNRKKAIIILMILLLSIESMSAFAASDRVRRCPVGNCSQYNYSYATTEGVKCNKCDIKVYDYFRCSKCGVVYAYCWNGHLK